MKRQQRLMAKEEKKVQHWRPMAKAERKQEHKAEKKREHTAERKRQPLAKAERKQVLQQHQAVRKARNTKARRESTTAAHAGKEDSPTDLWGSLQRSMTH